MKKALNKPLPKKEKPKKEEMKQFLIRNTELVPIVVVVIHTVALVVYLSVQPVREWIRKRISKR